MRQVSKYCASFLLEERPQFQNVTDSYTTCIAY